MFEYTVKPILETLVETFSESVLMMIWLIMMIALIVALSVFHVKEKRAWEREWNDVKDPDHEFHWIYKKVCHLPDEKQQQQLYKRIKRLSHFEF